MSGKYFWKLAVTALLVAFCLSYLVPLEDRDFGDYARKQSSSEAFHRLLDRAEEAAESDPALSVYTALRELANEERIDLSQYFPQYKLEANLTNVTRRNNILLPALLEDSKANLRRGLDIQGGVSVTFQVDPAARAGRSEAEYTSELANAVNIIERRVNQLGVSEPIVRPIGLDRIEVQLAGVSTQDNPNLLETIKAPARLSFSRVHPSARPGLDPQPAGYEAMRIVFEDGGRTFEEEVYVKRIPDLLGKHVERASMRYTEFGQIYVSLQLDDEGARIFANLTRELAGNPNDPNDNGRLAIVLDGQLDSAPRVNEEIRGGEAMITKSGGYSQREAQDLTNTLNNPLDLPLEVAEMYEVGPSMAADAIASGVKAAWIGIVAVSAFMLTYFMAGGIVALISVVLNVLIVLGVLASFQATLTLPGIAGIVLTVGMAVDANILIFERIREELRSGKNLRNALQGGFEKVFSTIFDANITTLLVSLVMYIYGTGPVKGFGLTLAIGVASTMFCALVVTRVMLELLFETGALKQFKMLSIVNNPKVDFMKYRKPAFLASWTLVAIGMVALFLRGDDIYGIDFTGGDEVILNFEQRVETAAIRDALEPVVGEVTPSYREPLGGAREELRVQVSFGEGDRVFAALSEAFPQAEFSVAGRNEIGPSVGAEIQRNAFLAIAISLGLILLYIAFRFEFGYGVGAIVATVHDILLTLGVFILIPDHQFTAPMVAAILLIVGYSLNDTIVCFDRIREELTLRPTTKLYDIINIAINAVISRSLLTSITTLLASLSLYIFGTGVINDIAFTFTIGIVVGTFSSIFIASPVFYFYYKGDRRSVESSHDVLPEYEWQASSKASSAGTSNE